MHSIIETQQHSLVGRISYPDSGWGLDFTKGGMLPPSSGEGKIRVELESDHDKLSDYFELDATPIVSSAFAKVISDSLVENYQFFPVTVTTPSQSHSDYFILNVVGRVSCVDMDNSDLSLYEGEIMRIKNLVPKDGLPGESLFRCEEYPLAIFIDSALRRTLEDSSLTGFLIKDALGWNDSHRF